MNVIEAHYYDQKHVVFSSFKNTSIETTNARHMKLAKVGECSIAR